MRPQAISAAALDLLLRACLLRRRPTPHSRYRLTAARDLQDLRDIEMRFQMIGERVQRGFYAGLVGQRRRDAKCASHAFRKASPVNRPCT
jgi:hypothetical protein